LFIEKTRAEEFAKINPQRKVPAIVDTDNGNFTMAESHAIMRLKTHLIKVSEQKI
jgi:glutathione S-transferase